MDQTPIVLVVRHPDAENTFTVQGDVRIIDVDLGSSFDASRITSNDAPAVREAVAGWRKEVVDLPPRSAVRQHVEALCFQLLEEVGSNGVSGSLRAAPGPFPVAPRR